MGVLRKRRPSLASRAGRLEIVGRIVDHTGRRAQIGPHAAAPGPFGEGYHGPVSMHPAEITGSPTMPYLTNYHLSEHQASVLLGPVAEAVAELERRTGHYAGR